MAVRLARREPLPPTSTMNDGSHEVPTLLLDVLAVTRANMMDTVIKDGFHRFEDVYRHIPANAGQGVVAFYWGNSRASPVQAGVGESRNA